MRNKKCQSTTKRKERRNNEQMRTEKHEMVDDKYAVITENVGR